MSDGRSKILYPVLIRFAKTGFMRFVGHLDWQAMQQAIFLRAGLPLVTGEGPSHRLKIKTSPPTPVGVASLAEFTYVLLSEMVYPEEVKRRIGSQCPEGIEVMAVKDAGYLVRKNPFNTIEAASYTVELGEGVKEGQFVEVLKILERIAKEPVPLGIDEESVKQFWGRILEIEAEEERIKLLVLQKEGETFHAGRCASFLEKTLGLPHYPLFTKTDYYRLKPSKRRLFR